MLVSDFPHFDMEAKDVVGAKFIDLVAALKIQASKGDARRMIKSGGFLLNNKKVTDEAYIFQPEDLIENKFVVIGVGKKTKYLLRIK
jgi:tyrosyl-tRNA synthetase